MFEAKQRFSKPKYQNTESKLRQEELHAALYHPFATLQGFICNEQQRV